MAELFDLIRFLSVAAILVSACIGDLKKREVSDLHWIVIGSFGIFCMLYSAYEAGLRWEYAMMIGGSVMILISILFDVECGRAFTVAYYSILAMMFIIPIGLAYGDPIVQEFATVPIVFLIFILLFASGAIKGGADVKCLIVLAMVFQTYPEFYGLPLIGIPSFELSLIFQFSIMVFFHAALFSLFAMVYFIALNIRNKDIALPQMLIGYRVDLDEVERSFAWPLEYADGDEIVRTAKAQDPDVIGGLREARAERIWVTPMLPFIIPITAAFVFMTLVGNLLFIPF